MVRACPRHGSLSKPILQITLGGGRHRGQQRNCWMDNVKEWISLPMLELLTRASCRKKRLGEDLYCLSCLPDDPIGQGTELN